MISAISPEPSLDEPASTDPAELLDNLNRQFASKRPEPLKLKKISWEKLWVTDKTPRSMGYNEKSRDVLPLTCRGIYRKGSEWLEIGEDNYGTVWLFYTDNNTGIRVRFRSCVACPSFPVCMSGMSLIDEEMRKNVRRTPGDIIKMTAFLARAAAGALTLYELPVKTLDDCPMKWAAAPFMQWRNAVISLLNGKPDWEAKLDDFVAEARRAASVKVEDEMGGKKEWEQYRKAAYAQLKNIIASGVPWRLEITPLRWFGQGRLPREEFAAAEVVDWDAFLSKVKRMTRRPVRYGEYSPENAAVVSFVPQLAVRVEKPEL